jgi:competence protein ComEC
MTVVNPTLLFDVGLILSAAATLGLILYTKSLTQWAEKGIERLFSANTAKQVVGVLSDVVLLTLAAQITTLPIIFLIFGRFSAISFLVNVLVIPVQAPIMILGIAAVVLGAIWLPLGQVVAWLVGIPLAYTLAIVRAAAQLPGASTPITVDPLVIGAYYVVLFSVTAIMSQPTEDRRALIERLRQNVSVSLLSILGLAIAGLLWAIVLSRPDGRLHVWFLAVGEGNAVLIQTPQGTHILIDGGENPTQLRTALGDRLPFYKHELDLLIITQPNRFNISALPPLFERYAVKAVITNGQPDKDDSYKALVESLKGARIDPLPLSAGYRLQVDDSVAIEVVNPESPPQPGMRIDDAPLMLRLTYGDASFLLTSSLSTKGTSALLTAAKSGRYLGATVLQLPAGGEMRIDDWLNLARPQIAIFEAQQGGQTAKFVDAVSPLFKDIPMYRTDKHGTIEISTDGKQLWISTARQSGEAAAGG